MSTFDPAPTWAAPLRMPLWARAIGARRYDGGPVRTKWGEFDPKFWGLTLCIGGYETAHLNIGFIKGQAFVRLPFLDGAICSGPSTFEQPAFGVSWAWRSFGDCQIWARWGRKSKMIEMPWRFHHIVTERLMANGSWAPDQNRKGHYVDRREGAWSADYPYHYMLDSGEVQHVTATVRRSRSQHRWEWFGRGPISNLLRRLQWFGVSRFEVIDVDFSEEVGSRRGSWKGGCVGCSYNMRPEETPRSALQRMQRERRFS